MLSRSGSRLILRQHSGPPRPDSGHTCRAFTVSYNNKSHNQYQMKRQYALPHRLSAVSPCWSGLCGACSRWCRGRGICWFVRRPVDLEPPAPGRWTPAWRAVARRQVRRRSQVPLTPPHPALPLPPHRTRAGRTPRGQTGGIWRLRFSEGVWISFELNLKGQFDIF